MLIIRYNYIKLNLIFSQSKEVCFAEKQKNGRTAQLNRPAILCESLRVGRAILREELLRREAYLRENGARVILAAAARAVLVGNAIVVGGYEQLRVALETDDGELAEGDVEPLCRVAGDEGVAEAGDDVRRYDRLCSFGADAVGGVHELEVERDGVDRLHRGDGQAVRLSRHGHGVGGEALDGTDAAAEHDALVEDGEADDGVAAGRGLAGDAVVIGDVDGVIALVEGY